MTSSPWTEATIARASSEYKLVLACPLRNPISSKMPPLAFPATSNVTGDVQTLSQAAHTADCLVLLRLQREARCRLCAAPSRGCTLFATSITKSTVPFWLLDAASEITNFTPTTSDVALNKSGRGPVLCSLTTHRDLMFGQSDVHCSCPPSLS